MKIHFIFIITIFFVSCKTAKQKDIKRKIGFEVVTIPLVVENDTIPLNELRFYKIKGAKDLMILMYQTYGAYSEKIPGKYQNNINQLLWNKVDLFDDNQLFTVAADGTETELEFFTSLIILDKNNRDCLRADHPLKDKLISFFSTKMKTLNRKPSTYSKLY